MSILERQLDRAQLDAEKMTPRQERQQGCIPMWVADMDFPAAEPIRAALLKRMEQPTYGYTGKTNRYYDAVTGWMKRRHGWDTKAEWITTTPGVVTAMGFAVRSVIQPGEKVVYQPPVYPPFKRMIEKNGGIAVPSPLKLQDGAFHMDMKDLEAKLSDPEVKLFFLCNPHNPVGRVWTRQELTQIGELCLKHGVTIFSDDIHHDLVLSGHAYTPIASLSPAISNITITATSPSKTFSIPGFKMGNIFIESKELRGKFRTIVENTGVSDLDIGAIEATIAAYNDSEAWFDEVLQYIEDNNKLVDSFIAERLPELKTFALEGTYLKWIDCRSLNMDGRALESFMLEQAKIWFSEGYTFGEEGAGFERMNLGTQRNNVEETLARLEQALQARA
ncbi:MalY/PatB family protein [Paenibacillus sp. 1001270B_150601_E10]|uniref:MalY/PatB family protein n=1 Tax=Paenibacillus sp. 1001270B_150601_E10 TaxID=2787079 RepID=UPI00189C9EAC|nr:MalY/PatB family protein [Paenibacillus sp. 1001270B_150601_E10]